MNDEIRKVVKEYMEKHTKIFFAAYEEGDVDGEDVYLKIQDAICYGFTAARRWIPVSKRPKESGTSLLVLIDEDIYEATFSDRIEKFLNPGGEVLNHVTHYQPAPEPPET